MLRWSSCPTGRRRLTARFRPEAGRQRYERFSDGAALSDVEATPGELLPSGSCLLSESPEPVTPASMLPTLNPVTWTLPDPKIDTPSSVGTVMLTFTPRLVLYEPLESMLSVSPLTAVSMMGRILSSPVTDTDAELRFLPADLAYGDKPTRSGVPAGPLVFDVELLGIQ